MKKIIPIIVFLLIGCLSAFANQPYRGSFFYNFGDQWDLLQYAGLEQDSNTKLLLHMDGADESTTFTDSSDSNHTPTPHGNAQIDTAYYKFPTASGLFDGLGDYVTYPDSADFYMGAGAFTIDCWIRLTQDAITNSASGGIYGQFDTSTPNDDQVRLWFWGSASASNRYLYFRVENSGVADVQLSYQWSDVERDVWYHIAVIRGWGGNVNDWALCIDGKSVDTDLSNSSTYPDLDDVLEVGRDKGSTPDGDMDGWIDEFRMVKGVAKWTNDFIPYTEPYN